MEFSNKSANRREENFISFDKRTDLHVVVDKKEGEYRGHPATATLEDGKTIFMTYPKSHAFGQIVLKKSEDGGKSWSGDMCVPESFSTSLEFPTIFRMVDAHGKSRLIIFSGRYPFRTSVSEDDGASFSELEPIGDFGGCFMSTMVSFGGGHYMAFFHDEGNYIYGGCDIKNIVYRAGSGESARTRLFTYVSEDGGKTYSTEGKPYWKNDTIEREDDVWEPIYESYEGKPTRFAIYTTETRDGGLTWSSPRMICTHPDAKLCEPCAFRSPDGSQIAVLMRDYTRAHNSFVIVSNDNGKTWSEPREVCDSLTGDRHMVTYLEDGRLFISLRDRHENSDYKNTWVAWVGTYEDVISGQVGDCRIHMKKHYYTDTEPAPADCAYPCLEMLCDGTLFAATYGRWEQNHEHYILSIRLSGEELKKIPYKNINISNK